mmetsp:Transcript_56082/g.120773  ORF Transcript_56082/g.120773 Transcript_56082/m.120773 type:complete len:937 (+) Transcript_56082:95-2905(+)
MDEATSSTRGTTSQEASIRMLMESTRCDEQTARSLLQGIEAAKEASSEAAAAKTSEAGEEPKKPSGSVPNWAEAPSRRARTTMGISTDGLGDKYSAMADDTSSAGKKREAAMLFSVAEKHLGEEGEATEDPREGLKMAKDALVMYQEIKDTVAEADTLRLIIHAHRLIAESTLWENEGEASAASRKEAEQVAKEGLAAFQEKGDKRGQAAMLISLAEVCLDARMGRTDKVRAEEALTHVQQARDLLSDSGADKLKAICLMTEALIQCKKYSYTEAVEASEEAEKAFFVAGDSKGRARSLHIKSVAHILKHEIDDGLDCSRDALRLARDMGSKKMIGFELLTVALIHMEREKPSEAIPLATEALELFQATSMGKGFEALAEQVICEGYLGKDEVDQAVELAEKGVARTQEMSDRREEVMAQMTLTTAHLANADFKGASASAEAALALCKEDLRDRGWEASVLLMLTQVYFEMGDHDKAQDTVNEAVCIFQDDFDAHHEAVASTVLSTVLIARGELENGLSAAEKGREMFKDEEERDQEVVSMLQIALAHRALGHKTEALQMAREASDFAREIGNKHVEANALSLVADFHILKEDFTEAVSAAQEMQRICQRAGSHTAEAYALHQLAGIHLRASEAKQAARAADVACKICAREHDRRGQVHMLILAAQAHMERIFGEGGRAGKSRDDAAKVASDASSKALKAVKEAVTVAKRLGSGIRPGLLAAAQYWNAQVLLLMQGRLHDSLQAADEARELLGTSEDTLSQAYATLLTARLHLALEREDKAEEACNDALALFKSSGDEEGQALAQQFLDNELGKRIRQQQMPAGFDPSMMMAQAALPSGGGESAGQSAMEVAKPKGLDPEEVAATVQAIAREAIGIDEGLYLDSPLMDSGMDSLTAVSFRNTLQQTLAVKLPSSLMFDYPTMKEVANRIVELSNDE